MSRRPLVDLPRPRAVRVRLTPLATELHTAIDDILARSRPHALAYKAFLAHTRAELDARDAKKRA
jgi:hypothetical protein